MKSVMFVKGVIGNNAAAGPGGLCAQRLAYERAMLADAKDNSELMIDLAYAAVYFNDPGSRLETVWRADAQKLMVDLIDEVEIGSLHKVYGRLNSDWMLC